MGLVKSEMTGGSCRSMTSGLGLRPAVLRHEVALEFIYLFPPVPFPVNNLRGRKLNRMLLEMAGGFAVGGYSS
jgi:hypothetical protein